MRQISSNHQSPVRNVKTDSDILSEEENLPNGDAFCQSPLLETKHVAQQKPERVSPFSFWEGRWQERSQTAYLSLFYFSTSRTFRIHLKGSLGFSYDSTITFTSHLIKAVRIVRIPEDTAASSHRNVDGIRAVASHRPCHAWSHWVQLGALMLFAWRFPNMSRTSSHWSHVPALLLSSSSIEWVTAYWVAVVHKENIWKGFPDGSKEFLMHLHTVIWLLLCLIPWGLYSKWNYLAAETKCVQLWLIFSAFSCLTSRNSAIAPCFILALHRLSWHFAQFVTLVVKLRLPARDQKQKSHLPVSLLRQKRITFSKVVPDSNRNEDFAGLRVRYCPINRLALPRERASEQAHPAQLLPPCSLGPRQIQTMVLRKALWHLHRPGHLSHLHHLLRPWHLRRERPPRLRLREQLRWLPASHRGGLQEHAVRHDVHRSLQLLTGKERKNDWNIEDQRSLRNPEER